MKNSPVFAHMRTMDVRVYIYIMFLSIYVYDASVNIRKILQC